MESEPWGARDEMKTMEEGDEWRRTGRKRGDGEEDEEEEGASESVRMTLTYSWALQISGLSF